MDPWWKPVNPAAHWEALASNGAGAGRVVGVPERAVV
jgi:hypothetical protein